MPNIEIVQDDPTRPRFMADDRSTPVDFVRFGMWDCAIRNLEPNAQDPNDYLFNEAAEQNNFIGSDTERFYIRVIDPDRRGSDVQVCDWITLWSDGKPLDVNARRSAAGSKGDARIFLVERSPGVFTSNALMLAVGDVDAGVMPGVVPLKDGKSRVDLRTHIGFVKAGLDPMVPRGGPHFRIRQGTMFGAMKVTYPSGGTSELIVPIFRRRPEADDERRRVEIQIFVVRDAATRDPVVKDIRDPACRLWTGNLRKAREIYERFGVYLQTTVPTTLPAGSEVIEIKGPSGVDRAVILGATAPVARPKDSESATIYASTVIAEVYKIRQGKGELVRRPSNVIPVLYMPYDAQSRETGVDNTRSDEAVINANNLGKPLLDIILAHEIGHVLMRHHKAGGHWETPFPDFSRSDWETNYDAPNHKFRFDFNGNLMLADFGRGADSVDTVFEQVRLWSFPDKNGYRELVLLKKARKPFLQSL